MSLFISIVFLFLSISCYSLDKKILNPIFVNSFIWGLLIFLFNIIPNDLYSLNEQFLLSVFLWVFFFTATCMISQSGSNYNFKINLYNKKIFNIYFYIIVFCAPLTLLLLISEAIKVGPDLFFLRLRIINTGLDEEDTFSLGYFGYIFNFSTSICLLFTYYSNYISKKKYYIVIILSFLLGLITLARTTILMLIVGIFIIRYFQGRIKRKHYIYFLILILIFLLIVTSLRGQSDHNTSLGNTISIYIFGGFPAFDTITPTISNDFGAYTFRFTYAILKVFDKSIIVQQTILPYVSIPQQTNVYTVMFPFFKDFGYIGIIVFSSIYGFIFGTVYKLAKQKISLYIIIFSFIFPCLLLQFIGEYIFSNFSTYLQYFILLLIPYYFKTS
ncbi:MULTISPECIES: O-antigen polymerase [unclassified Empedobacter]|uniref:O-antigen polymerase n=1 Tax=unclassified Empedobacter TaxID=2643773 RepID=UPI0025C3D818|nr:MULTISPECIES: O-antigen polymerase [unclassified Empedobacter]